MTSTIREVAQLAGTSIATVSRALNQPEKVLPTTRSRVLAAAAALDFRPNLLGRQLRSRRTRLVGVVLPDLSNPVFGECLQGVEESAGADGYGVMLMTTHYDPVREQRAIETLCAQRVDGLVMTVACAGDHARLDELERAGIPYQLVYNQCLRRPCVCVDNRGAARDGVALLIARGHRRIAMLCGMRSASDRAAQTYQGYLDAVFDAGLEPWPLLELPGGSHGLSPGALEPLFGPHRPTALFCGDDFLALLVLCALRERGLSVPRDMSVIGFDGLALGAAQHPALTSVCQPNAELGRRAWACLKERLDGRAAGTHACVLPHTIRVGATVAGVFPEGPAAAA